MPVFVVATYDTYDASPRGRGGICIALVSGATKEQVVSRHRNHSGRYGETAGRFAVECMEITPKLLAQLGGGCLAPAPARPTSVQTPAFDIQRITRETGPIG